MGKIAKKNKIKTKWKLLGEAHLLKLRAVHLDYQFQFSVRHESLTVNYILKTGQMQMYSFPSVFPHS
jgi:hypothetical protein